MSTHNTVYCYDRFAQHKLLGLVLAAVALTAIAFGAAQLTPAAPQQTMNTLPRVVIEGKSQATLAAERAQALLVQAPAAAGSVQMERLPRVVVEGRRSLEGSQLAAALPLRSAQ